MAKKEWWIIGRKKIQDLAISSVHWLKKVPKIENKGEQKGTTENEGPNTKQI